MSNRNLFSVYILYLLLAVIIGASAHMIFNLSPDMSNAVSTTIACLIIYFLIRKYRLPCFIHKKISVKQITLFFLIAVIISISMVFSAQLLNNYMLLTDSSCANIIKSTMIFEYQEIAKIPLISSIISCLLTAIFEEFFYRKIIFMELIRRTSIFMAILISSIAFAIPHLIPYFKIDIFFFGAYFALLYLLTGRLWVSIVAHFFHNFIHFLFAKFFIFPASIYFLPVYISAIVFAFLSFITMAILARKMPPLIYSSPTQTNHAPLPLRSA